jgi:hypothetical protein
MKRCRGLVDGHVEHGFDPFRSLPVFVRGVFDATRAQLISTRAANVVAPARAAGDAGVADLAPFLAKRAQLPPEK